MVILASAAKLLIKHGFIKSDSKEKYEDKTPKEIEEKWEEGDADVEVWEEAKDQFVPTEFPKPLKRYRIVLERYNMSVEGPYFWIYNYISTDLGYNKRYKTIDTFSAAENSAFFGVSQMRIGAQQEKVSGFLSTIGKMIKDVFQLVRELRIIDERLGYYRGSWGIDEKGNPIPEGPRTADEITLKGIWIDMVQGGSKNPSSVFGMAREVGFIALPDLFFSTHPTRPEDVDEYVETHRGGFNVSVKNILKRELAQYLRWKKSTYDELRTRKNFTLKYLKQHYDVIKMYMTWVKPYIRHIRRLSLDDEKTLTPELVSSFETSMLEIEFLGAKLPVDIRTKKGNSIIYSCILAHFDYRTKPAMSFQQEGYQRGPIHVGRMNMDLRAYAWTEKQINNYLKMKEEEDLELLKSISESVKAAMESMGGALETYLKEAEEEKQKEEKKGEQKEKKLGLLEQARLEFFGPKREKEKKPKRSDARKDEAKIEGEKSHATKIAKGDMFLLFKNFKKAHGLIMW